MTNVTKINDLLNDTDPAMHPVKVRGKPGPKPGGERNTPRIILKHKHMAVVDPRTGKVITRSILPSHPPPTPATSERTPKARSLTAHQAAVAENRKERADHIIDRKLKRLDRRNNKKRKREGVLLRTWKRIKDMDDPFANSDEEGGFGDDGSTVSGIRFDAEGGLILLETGMKDGNALSSGDAGVDDGVRLNVIEANAQLNNTPSHNERKRGSHKQHPLRAKYVNGTNHRGCAGLVPRDDELDDYGEEAIEFAAAIRRTQRRLDRWEMEESMKNSGAVIGNGYGKQNNQGSINGTGVDSGNEKHHDTAIRVASHGEDEEMKDEPRVVEVGDDDIEMSADD